MANPKDGGQPPKPVDESRLEPQDEAALDYMLRKGLDHLAPVGIEVEIVGKRWIYSYDLPDGGELDLIVEWLADVEDWDVRVLDFRK